MCNRARSAILHSPNLCQRGGSGAARARSPGHPMANHRLRKRTHWGWPRVGDGGRTPSSSGPRTATDTPPSQIGGSAQLWCRLRRAAEQSHWNRKCKHLSTRRETRPLGRGPRLEASQALRRDARAASHSVPAWQRQPRRPFLSRRACTTAGSTARGQRGPSASVSAGYSARTRFTTS